MPARTITVAGENRVIDLERTAAMLVFCKNPTDKLDYVVDWQKWIGADTIATSTWAILGPDAVLAVASSPVSSNTSTTATAWLEGGTLGESYVVTNTIVTVGGRTSSRAFKVQIQQR